MQNTIGEGGSLKWKKNKSENLHFFLNLYILLEPDSIPETKGKYINDISTICPSHDPFYIVAYYKNWVKASAT